MNYVCISPSFPPNYVNFAVRLRERGARVLGIGSEPYDQLPQALRHALTEYYRVYDMENYEGILQACGYFTHKYGKIDRIESHNEYWLATDARLRTDFNVFGLKIEDIDVIKFKSRMKDVFVNTGIPVARGRVVRTLDEARELVEETGWPVCAKPDCGVGATHTYKLCDDEDLQLFFNTKPPVDYIVEEFIDGEIHTFDGLADRDGRVVFTNAFVFGKGVMETVNEGLDMFYHTLREIPEDLNEYGLNVVRAFNLRERFFHIEFFRTSAGLIALEINARPPGGWSMDIFNYSKDADLYDQYARLVLEGGTDASFNNRYYVAYVGLKEKEHIVRTHSREEIATVYSDLIIQSGHIDSIFAAAIGNYAYILRSPDLEPLKEAAGYILERVREEESE